MFDRKTIRKYPGIRGGEQEQTQEILIFRISFKRANSRRQKQFEFF